MSAAELLQGSASHYGACIEDGSQSTSASPGSSHAGPSASGSEDAVRREGDDDTAAGKEWFDVRTFLRFAGPGLLMSIAYLDVGNLEADLQQGATTGFQLMWVLCLAHCGGCVLQALAARLGNVTGMHLAEVCREEMPECLALTLYAFAEVAVISVDIQQMLGGATALAILFKFPLFLGCVVCSTISMFILWSGGDNISRIQVLFSTMVAVMTLSFLANYFQNVPSAGDLAYGFVPGSLTNSGLLRSTVAVLGAVVMPHNLFLHSGLVLKPDLDIRDARAVREANKYCTLDTALALFGCFLVNMCVVCSFAQNFHSSSCSGPVSGDWLEGACVPHDSSAAVAAAACTINGGPGQCTRIGLEGAGDALQSSLSTAAKYVWAVGLLAASQCSVVTGTFAGQFIMCGFLRLDIAAVPRAALTRVAAVLPVAILTRLYVNEGQSSDSVGEWMNVMQSVMLPFALVPVLLFTSSRKLMGEHVNASYVTVMCWILAILVIAADIWTIADAVSGLKRRSFKEAWHVYSWLFAVGCGYAGVLYWVVRCHRAAEEEWLSRPKGASSSSGTTRA